MSSLGTVPIVLICSSLKYNMLTWSCRRSTENSLFMFVPFLLLVRPVRETKQLVGLGWDHSTTVTQQLSFVSCVLLYRVHNDEIQAVAGLELGMTGRISQLCLRV